MPPRAVRNCLIALVAVLILSGCRSEQPRRAGYLYLRLNSNPTTLDPALITDVQGGGIAAKIFNGLVRFNDELDIVPDIAHSWSLSPDRKTYVFRLRKDVHFSNGRTVTARDFQYSFERVLNPKTRAPLTWVLDKLEGAREYSAGKADSVSGIVAQDDQTLILRLEKPFGPFLSLLAMTTAYAVPREAVEQYGPDFGTHPVGTGPYTLEEWKHGQTLVLNARKDYFDGTLTLAGMVYRIIPEDLTAVLEFETGNLDVLLIPSAEYRRFRNDPEWNGRVFGEPGLNSYYLGLNCTRPPFNSKPVRQAVNMAIDREHILNTVFEKRGILARGPVPPGLWKQQPRSDSAKEYDYDPEKAREILEREGAVGATVRIYISADPEVLDIITVIQRYLAAVGLKAEITQLDWSAFKHAVNKGVPDAFWLSWWADYPDPENFLFPLFHSLSVGPSGNRTRFLDPELDRLIETAQRTPDDGKRYDYYRRAEARIRDNAPWVFMWHKADYYVVQPWVKNFRVAPIYSIEKKMDVRIER